MASPRRALPSPWANSGVSSLPSSRSPAGERGAFGAEGFGRAGCRCLQQGLTPPHPKRPSQLQGSGCRAPPARAGDNPDSLGVTGAPRAPFSPASGPDPERKVWSREMPGEGSGCCRALLRARPGGRGGRAAQGPAWLCLGGMSQPCLGIAAAIYSIHTPECEPQEGSPKGCAAAGWHGCPRVPLWAQPCERCQPRSGTLSVPMLVSGSRSPRRGDSSGTARENISAKPRLSQPGT